MREIGLSILFLWLLGPGSVVAFAQGGDITRTVDIFSEIKVYDGISVKLIPSDKNQVVIRGEDTDKVAVVNTNGILKIRMQITRIFSGYRTYVDLYYNSPLKVIDVNEDALITSDEVLKQEVLEVKAQEGGEIRISAEVTQFLVKAVSGGMITASGSSANQDVQINTGGIYKGSKLETGFCTVNVNAGSTAEINARDYVKAVVKAGGKVLVYGDPDKMEEKTVFGGTIKRM